MNYTFGLTYNLTPNNLLFDERWLFLPYSNFLALFVVWQTGMAAALGWVIDTAKRKR